MEGRDDVPEGGESMAEGDDVPEGGGSMAGSEGAAGPGGSMADRDVSEDRLDALRRRILEVDEELIRLVGERRDLVVEVGRVKEALGFPVLDPRREAQVVRRAAETARELGVDEEMVRDVVWRIIAAARDAQEDRSRWGPPSPPEDAGDD